MLIKLVKDEVKSLKSDKHKKRGSSGKNIQTATTGKTDSSSHP